MQAGPTDEMEITALETQSAGDWAYSRGVYSVAFPLDNGEQGFVDGKFMTILQRQPDGSWKIHRDIYNSNVPPAPVAAPATDAEAVAEAINAVWREYEASILAGDPERWIQLWADNGVQLPPGAPPVVGKEAIFPRISNDLETFEYSEFAITNEDVEVNGDLAFARGNYVVTFAPKSGGEAMSLDGKYMTIFRQQSDGSWKIYRDIFNSNGPTDGEADEAATEVEDVTTAIDAFWREYEASVLAGNAERCDKLWTEAGVQAPSDLPAAVVEEATFPVAANAVEHDDFSQFVINNEAVEVHDDWALARGTYMAQCTPKAFDDLVELEGEYMAIFLQQEDGAWKLYHEMFESGS